MVNTEDIDSELLEDFKLEVREHCGRMEELLLGMQDGVPDANELEELFRIAHSIKGTGMAVGIPTLPEFVHTVEDLLSSFRSVNSAESGLSHDTISALLQAKDAIERFLNAFPETSGWDEVFSKLTDQLRLATQRVPETTPYPSAPESPAVRSDEPRLAEETPPEPPQPPGQNSIRVKLDRVDALIRRVGELSVHQQMLEGRLTDILDNPELSTQSRKLSQTSREVHDLAMSLRMIPIGPTIRRLQRTCRDTSHKLAKKVEFKSTGEDIEVDIVLVQAIADALVHLVRNAMDHGIESPSERMQVDKPETAVLSVEVSQGTGYIEIAVRDDGRGLSEAKIRERAVQRGLLGPDADLTPDQIWPYIFHPGFSTAENVTEFSGRGVGLDVVLSSLREVDGAVTVESSAGEGTTFLVRVPLSLSVVDVMQVAVDSEHYLVPLHMVSETIAVTKSNLRKSQSGDASLILLRGKPIHVFKLSKLLEGQLRPVAIADRYSALVTGGDSRPLALIVDEIVGRRQVVVKPLGPELSHVRGISGCAILGDGRVGLIVDLPGITHQFNVATA